MWLAVTLHRTVAELQSMSSVEYTYWIAYKRLLDNPPKTSKQQTAAQIKALLTQSTASEK